jgi:two-component system chemotaxis response regulator CheB
VVEAEPLPSRVIGVAASAGAVEPLLRLVSGLPADLDAAVCVVLHIPATGRSLLAPILDRHSPLKAVLAEHGTRLRPGVIYVAPADHHLLVREEVVELSRGPKENGVRPAADPLFRSIARAWGPYGVAVVLSGALDDGSSGAAVLAEAGGTVVVQDPADALVASMPSSAIAATTPDAVVPIVDMAAVLRRIVDVDIPGSEEEAPVSAEPDPVEMLHGPNRPDGPSSGFTCPECSGALWELRDGNVTRFRCRVGHSYSEEAMVEAQGASVEAALWAALEALEERAELLRRIADRSGTRPRTQGRFRTGAQEAEERAALIRRVLSAGLTRDDEVEGAAAG